MAMPPASHRSERQNSKTLSCKVEFKPTAEEELQEAAVAGCACPNTAGLPRSNHVPSPCGEGSEGKQPLGLMKGEIQNGIKNNTRGQGCLGAAHCQPQSFSELHWHKGGSPMWFKLPKSEVLRLFGWLSVYS